MKTFFELREKLEKSKDDPCWKDYVQVGMKKKNGKEVPNCVPKEGTDFASQRAKPNLTKDDSEKMGKVADMLKKEREKKMKKEEVEEAAGAYSRYTASEIKKRRDEREKRNAGTTQAQRTKNKMYGNMMGKLKDQKESTEIEEKAVSKAQQKFMGMVRAKQKGEMDDASPEVAKAAKSMSKKDVKDFASTKHKGLPAKKESVDEADSWMKDSGWRKAQKMRKDRFGNTVKDKNVAKHLAKRAQKKTAEMDK